MSDVDWAAILPGTIVTGVGLLLVLAGAVGMATRPEGPPTTGFARFVGIAVLGGSATLIVGFVVLLVGIF